ncbi:MAG TPA: Cna B-type domain-containing protein [Erysipelotrichaceae bacterium]|nr:Cna B-type domain-containing protein [Erysipelotrichaceae bacterium]
MRTKKKILISVILTLVWLLASVVQIPVIAAAKEKVKAVENEYGRKTEENWQAGNIIRTNNKFTYNYQQIKDLLLNDDSIAFNPDTQTFIVVEIEATRSENAERLIEKGILTEERLSAAMKFVYNSSVFINGTALPRTSKFYIYDGTVLSEALFKNNYPNATAPMVDSSVGVNIFIINKGDTCSVVPNARNLFWGTYNGGNLFPEGSVFTAPNPKSSADLSGYTEDNILDPLSIRFNYEWEIYKWLELETWFISEETKTSYFATDNCPEGPAFNVNYLIELRDESGNIFPLPSTMQESYDSIQNRFTINSNSTVTHTVERDSDIYWTESGIRIPAGYDFRITATENNLPIGINFSAYEDVNYNAAFDEHGFYLVMDDYSSGDFIVEEYFIIPTETIRVEKIVEKTETDEDFYFIATKSYHITKYNNDGSPYEAFTDIVRLLQNYPYYLYNSETDELIGEYMTSMQGEFSLKAGQYALFPVWKIPDDFKDYHDMRWFDGYLEIFKYFESVATPLPESSVYTFEEITIPAGYETRIEHISSGVKKEIAGTLVTDVHNTDEIVFINKMGTIDISCTTIWDDADDLDKIRPESLTVRLLADGEDTGKVIVLTAANNWTDIFTELIIFQPGSSGQEINYEIADILIEGYTSTISGDATQGFIITNYHRPTTSIPDTGDDYNIALWTALMFLSAGLTLVLLRRELKVE